MKLLDLVSPLITSKEISYFIIDSGQHVADDDFKVYTWHRSRNNKIKPGDVFIYRKPQKISGNGQFYLYGCGQFESVNGQDAVTAPIINSHPFKRPIMQSDLEDFVWQWKERGRSWEHFWNQYGINEILHEDFVNILKLIDDTSYESDEDARIVEAEAKISKGNFYVDDTEAVSKVRPWQGGWSNKVKQNYGYQCALCDIKTPLFLVGSHIIPVSKDKNNRMNPSNGLCLCVLHDTAFDNGFIAVADDGEVLISNNIEADLLLVDVIKKLTRTTIRKPLRYIPDTVFLTYHREKIFKG